MNHLIKKATYILLFVCFILLQFSCSSKVDKSFEYGSKTKELIEIVETNPEIKQLLIKAIAKGKKINPDKKTNPAQTLDEYYEFVTWAEKSMPWNMLPGQTEKGMYHQIDQSLCYFFFINDLPLEDLDGRGLFNNSLQYVDPYKSWLTSFNIAWGRYMDTEESWNDEYYQEVLKDDIFGLQKGWYEDPAHWKTFNDFFARNLKSPDQRPIASSEDSTVVVSPADAAPQGTWAIDSNSMIVEKSGVAIKSATLYDVKKLIGEDSPYSEAFANGTFTHSFLDVGDYHRYHFPVSGEIKEVKMIQGEGISGGITTWSAEENRYKFDPSSVGWQMLETRGVVIVETKTHGLVALLPIGMFPVSSVNFEDTVKEGSTVSKGDMLGYFLFGGSDFIMIFQKEAGFQLDSINLQDDGTYQHLLMGEKLGRFGNI